MSTFSGAAVPMYLWRAQLLIGILGVKFLFFVASGGGGISSGLSPCHGDVIMFAGRSAVLRFNPGDDKKC